MHYLTPPVNLTGTFNLKTPLTALVNEKVTYTVDSIKSINSLLDEDIDVQKLVYLDQGLTTEDYVSALNNKISIVTLRSEGSSLVTIPEDYLASVPQIVGKIFIQKAIILNIGHVPDELNLDFILEPLKDEILDLTGLNSEAELVDISGQFIESYDNHEAFEITRNTNMSDSTTCKIKLLEAQELLNKQQMKITQLLAKL